MSWSLILATGISLFYIASGFKVPPLVITGTLLIGIVLLFTLYILNKGTYESTLKWADRHFLLKDGLISTHEFKKEKKKGTLYQLQETDTSAKVQHLKVESIQSPFPKTYGWCSLLFALLLCWFLTFDDAPQIKQKKINELKELSHSEKVRKILQDELDRLEKEMDEKEKELLQKSKIKDLLKKLKATPDKKESLRNYARIEKELQSLKKNHSTSKDQKYLKALSDRLKNDQLTKALAKNLKDKNYKQAAKDFEKMQMKKMDKLKDHQSKLDQLKSLSEKMNNLAKSDLQKNSFDQLSEQLSKNMSKLDHSMTKAQQMMGKSQKISDEMMKQLMKDMQNSNQSLAKISDKLQQLHAKNKFLSQMNKLKNALAMSQFQLNQKGKQAGSGVDYSKNNEKTDPLKNKNYSKLTGQKGQGSSLVRREEASSGKGVSLFTGSKVETSYKRTLESIIKREDIPEELKGGVKNYFETIHQTENAIQPQ